MRRMFPAAHELVEMLQTPYKDPIKKAADVANLIMGMGTPKARESLMECWMVLAKLPTVPGILCVVDEYPSSTPTMKDETMRLIHLAQSADLTCRFFHSRPGKRRERANRVASSLIRKLEFIRAHAGEAPMALWFEHIRKSRHIPYADYPEDPAIEPLEKTESARILADNFEEFGALSGRLQNGSDITDVQNAVAHIVHIAQSGKTHLAQALLMHLYATVIGAANEMNAAGSDYDSPSCEFDPL